MPQFENEGLSLAYEVHGSGHPVVMLHGAAVSFAGNFGLHGWIDTFVAGGLQVIGLDFRGHGGSAKPYDGALYGMEHLSGDVVALLDHLGIERAGLVGFSIGSTVALHVLHSHPGRFVAGALVATGDGLIGIPPHTFPTMNPALAATVRRPAYPDDLPPELASYWTFAEQIAGDRAAVAAFAEGDFTPCTVEEVSAVKAPVLVLCGSKDVVLGTGRQLAESIPKAKYVELEDATHFSLAVDKVAQQAVAAFLAENL